MLVLTALVPAFACQAQRGTDGRIREGIARLSAVPSDPAARLVLASAYLQKMRETADFAYVDKAGVLVHDVLAQDESNYEALQALGSVALERHQFHEVEKLMRRLIDTQPNDFRNHAMLGDALLELGRYDEAAEVIQRLADLRPNLTAYNRAAQYRFLMGDLPGAIEFMQTAVRIGSDSPENTAWCLVELGSLLLKAERLPEAANAFTRALDLMPHYHSALAGMGRLNSERGDPKKSIEYFRRAQDAVPLPEYAAALSELYTAENQNAEAAKQLALIDTIDMLGRARGENANRALALIYADQKRNPARAIELARGELEKRGGVYTYDALAWALYQGGNTREAVAAMKEALRYNTPDPLLKAHAAQIFRSVALFSIF